MADTGADRKRPVADTRAGRRRAEADTRAGRRRAVADTRAGRRKAVADIRCKHSNGRQLEESETGADIRGEQGSGSLEMHAGQW